MKNETVDKLEALLDTALEHFSHGWLALEKQGMVTYKDPDVFPPSVSDEVGSASYHFAAVADTVKRAYEIIAAQQSVQRTLTSDSVFIHRIKCPHCDGDIDVPETRR